MQSALGHVIKPVLIDLIRTDLDEVPISGE